MKPKNKAILFLASVESLMQLLLNDDYRNIWNKTKLHGHRIRPLNLSRYTYAKKSFICLKRDDVTNSIT